MGTAPTRILIIRLSAIGDVLRVLPAQRVLRRAFPDAHIAWAVEPLSRDLLAAQPDIDDILVFPKREIVSRLRSPRTMADGLRLFREFIAQVRASRFDRVYDFHGLLKSGLISRLSGAPQRIGFTAAFTKELNFLCNNRRYPAAGTRISRVERNLSLLAATGLDTTHAPVRLHLPAEARAFADSFFRQAGIDRRRPVVVVHPGTSVTTPYKRWESYRYAVVADRVIEENGAQILFTWAGAELAMVREIMGQMKYRAVVGPETPSLCQLAALFSLSDVYLGGDTGPMHLAAVTGTPIVGLFVPTDHVVKEPYLYTPHIIIRDERIDCSPCRSYTCRKRSCMKAISEESVIRAVTIMLESFDRRGAGDTAPAQPVPPT